MSETGYNGWTNHETWATALHWDNDQGSYSERCEMVDDACEGSEDRDDAVNTLAEMLADRTDEAVSEALETIGNEWARLYIMDLMPRGSDVNWREIAESWIDEDNRTYGQADE